MTLRMLFAETGVSGVVKFAGLAPAGGRMAQPSSTRPARCNRCGETWPRDPALEVACPSCPAGVGEPCKRPSEHKAWTLHAARDRAAMAAGLLKKCTGKKPEENN